MDRSPGFGSTPCNYIALLRLAFATAPPNGLTLLHDSNSLTHDAKGTQSPVDHEVDMRLPLLVSTRFQVLFHSPPGVLFTFPSRYLFTIGHRVVFSLGRWSSQIPTGFHVSRGTREHDPGRHTPISLTGLSPSMVDLSRIVLLSICFVTPRGSAKLRSCPTTPMNNPAGLHHGLGSSPFARRY